MKPKIVICVNRETVEDGLIPEMLRNYWQSGEAADVWISAAADMAAEITGECPDYDSSYRHYHGGHRTCLVEIDLGSPSYDHPVGPDADLVVDTIRHAAERAVFEYAARELSDMAAEAEKNPEDWPEVDVSGYRAEAEKLRAEAEALVVDSAAAEAAWAALKTAYAEEETEEEIEMDTYKIAVMRESGDFEIVDTFEAENNAEANVYAESNYSHVEWYVLKDGKNINS